MLVEHTSNITALRCGEVILPRSKVKSAQGFCSANTNGGVEKSGPAYHM